MAGETDRQLPQLSEDIIAFDVHAAVDNQQFRLGVLDRMAQTHPALARRIVAESRRSGQSGIVAGAVAVFAAFSDQLELDGLSMPDPEGLDSVT